MRPVRLSMGALSRRVAELARRAQAEQERIRREAQRAESIRIIMDPEAREAALEMFDWICERAGVDVPEGRAYTGERPQPIPPLLRAMEGAAE